VLRSTRERQEVHSVLVGICEVMGPDAWSFSSHVYVVTAASAGEVGGWAVELEPGDD
jgi:hypothetical protein